jgi:hypothetical protein
VSHVQLPENWRDHAKEVIYGFLFIACYIIAILSAGLIIAHLLGAI